MFCRVIYLQVSMNEGLSYITSSVHITTTECVSTRCVRFVSISNNTWWFDPLACCHLWNFSVSFQLVIFSSLLLSSLTSPLLCLSSEGAVSTSWLFSFHFSFWLLAQDRLKPRSFCVLHVVRRHHRAGFPAGCLLAAGSAADVVVLAALLHPGKFVPQASVFQLVDCCFFRTYSELLSSTFRWSKSLHHLLLKSRLVPLYKERNCFCFSGSIF